MTHDDAFLNFGSLIMYSPLICRAALSVCILAGSISPFKLTSKNQQCNKMLMTWDGMGDVQYKKCCEALSQPPARGSIFVSARGQASRSIHIYRCLCIHIYIYINIYTEKKNTCNVTPT